MYSITTNTPDVNTFTIQVFCAKMRREVESSQLNHAGIAYICLSSMLSIILKAQSANPHWHPKPRRFLDGPLMLTMVTLSLMDSKPPALDIDILQVPMLLRCTPVSLVDLHVSTCASFSHGETKRKNRVTFVTLMIMWIIEKYWHSFVILS